MDSNLTHVRRAALDLAEPLLRGRTVFLTGSAAASERMTRFLADAGARVASIDLEINIEDTRDRFAVFERVLGQPTEKLRATLDSEDPMGAALVYAGSFTGVADVCGRRVIGARSRQHLDAERKDKQRELLCLGGEVIRLADGLAHLSLPAVVQGIPDDGVAMATSHTYLVPRSADENRVQELTATLERDCTRAVVSAFDVGVPCTFYGFVTATAIVDFGPVEALVYWNPRTWRLHAPGILRPLATTENLLAAARSAVHLLAQQLHERLGYVGAFGTDGVLTATRYTIHEVNPRVCAGFSLLDRLVPGEAPLAAIDLALREFSHAPPVLAAPLTALAAAIQRDPTPAYQLWEAPSRCYPPADAQFDLSLWTRQIRTMAAGDFHPVVALKEHI